MTKNIFHDHYVVQQAGPTGQNKLNVQRRTTDSFQIITYSIFTNDTNDMVSILQESLCIIVRSEREGF